MAFEANANSNNKPKWFKYANPANWFKGIWHFIIDSKNEIKRITWPDKSKINRSTSVVISTVLVITLFIWLLDSIFGKGLEYFFKLI